MNQSEKESQKNSENFLQKYSLSSKSPHFWWLIIILVLTIVSLTSYIISDRVCCSENLMNYISVCSVLLSITLSIFAIQYTYTSNNEIHRQFDKINSAADSIKSTSENLAVTNTLLKESIDQIQEKLDNSQKQIENQISDIKNSVINSSDIPKNNLKN